MGGTGLKNLCAEGIGNSETARNPEFGRGTELTVNFMFPMLRTQLEQAVPPAASVSDGVCHIHLSPIPAPGTIQAGGDLTVSVNSDTDEIIGYERGQ